LFGERFAEGDAGFGASAHVFEGALGDSDQAHAVVDSAGAKAALGDFESAAFAQQ